MAKRKQNPLARNSGKNSRVKVDRRLSRKSNTKSFNSSTGGRSRLGNFVLPMFLSVCIVICLGAIGFLGYRTVTASDFFNVAKIEVRGTERASATDIQGVIEMQTERSGAWHADLPSIKERIERIPFVRSAAVSRVLPDGIRVHVFESVPQALIRTSTGDMLIDENANIIAPAKGKEETLPFVMVGWNEAKSEGAGKENLDRVKMYQKMLSEWREFSLASRVKLVDASDMREPRAYIEDSGTTVSIALGRDKFGEYLRRGINAIVGKGDMFEAVNLVGQNMVLVPRKGK